MTGGTYRFASVSCQHDAVLYLVLVLAEHVEEGIYEYLVGLFSLTLFSIAVPEYVFFLLGKLIVRLKYRKTFRALPTYKFLLPHPHFLTSPTNYSSVHDAERRVRDDELFVYTYHAAEAFARWTCSSWRIEREHLVVGFFKANAVGLKANGEAVQSSARIEAQQAFAITFKEGGFYRIAEAV